MQRDLLTPNTALGDNKILYQRTRAAALLDGEWGGSIKDNIITTYHEVIAEKRQRLLLYIIALHFSSIPCMDNKYLFCPKHPDKLWGPLCPLRISPMTFLRQHLNLFIIIIFKVKAGLNTCQSHKKHPKSPFK